jgi:YHS domain-containing protein
MAIDPVCKMTVDKSAPPATSEYDGVTYYFCAPGCKVAFDENPNKYLRIGKKRSLLSRLIPIGRSRPGH